MSKAQINYLLALATLFVIWLFVNTFCCNAKKNYGGNSSGGTMYASAGRSPNPAGMQTISQLPNMTELLKNQARIWQASAASRKVSPVPSEAAPKDKTAKS
jgi:hypothetical protein